MFKLRNIGWLLILLSLLAAVGELLHLQLPTLRWAFNTSRDMPMLQVGDAPFLWFGWLFTAVFLLIGLLIVTKVPKDYAPNPITQRRIERFKSMKKGYISLIIVAILAFLCALDQSLVGKKALFVSYEGQKYFPAFVSETYKWKDFGFADSDKAESEVNYRELKRLLAQTDKGKVIMPFVPYDPTLDSESVVTQKLKVEEGKIYEPSSSELFSGMAATVYDPENPERLHIRYECRRGRFDGIASGFDESGKKVYTADYREGEIQDGTVQWSGDGSLDAFLKLTDQKLQWIHYQPAPPIAQKGHLLGTNSQGYDVLAYLYGGLQLNFKAALIYIPLIYMIGITVGLLMGYFGGTFDIIVQRLIEIFSNIPFLFVIMIFSSAAPEEYKGLFIIIVILVIFGWMGMTNLMRTAALKEKARDYVAASRVIGASTPRIMFRHILPNTVAILVTLVPFSVSSLVMALTSLDYLGFGLPSQYASWGRLMKDGLDYLSKPWLVSSAFLALFSLLILVTFIGEAVREAFDPKKYTYYK